MRLPPSVRYFPSRLQFIWNPWLWLGILITTIVGVYAWEYRQNPRQLPWQIDSTGLGSSGDATSTDVLLESLTPEEQAVAAELDNVELLLAQLDSDVSALTSGGESSVAASLNALGNGNGKSGESGVERLTRYIDEYSFLGTNARGSNIQIEQEEVLVQRPVESILNLQPDATTQPDDVLPLSALSQALARQQTASEVSPASPAQVDIDSRGLPVTVDTSNNPEIASEETADNAATPTTFGFDQTGVVPGSLDGLNRSFIRTTPNMSPPPGTTGYVPPTSSPAFNQLNQSAGASSFPTPAQPSFDSFNSPSSSAPDSSQVLPPADGVNTAPLATPTFDGAAQPVPDQPRNAWESFWD